MYPTTLFLAQLLSPVMMVIGLAFLLRKDEMKGMMKEMGKSTFSVIAFSLIELTAGTTLVLKHNVWNDLTTGIISAIGWIMILEGTFGLLTSRQYLKNLMSQLSVGIFSPTGFLYLLVGGYLGWQGYFA